jgi:transcriptional regulator with XRE-family HTH domain
MPLGKENEMMDQQSSAQSVVAVEEGFVVDVQSFLAELMDARGVSRADLARAMGVSRGRVSQIFSDECTNLTVRLLARAVHALGEVPSIDCDLVRQRRADRDKARRDELIRAAPNVIPFWRDASEEERDDDNCTNDDNRLDGLVTILRKAGGVR